MQFSDSVCECLQAHHSYLLSRRRTERRTESNHGFITKHIMNSWTVEIKKNKKKTKQAITYFHYYSTVASLLLLLNVVNIKTSVKGKRAWI